MAGEIKKVLFSEGVSVTEPTAVDLAYTATNNVFTESQTLDNQKELRFREATANGTNYASFKAPASLAATYDLTLPPDDGSSGQVLQTDGSGVLSWSDGGGGSGEKNYITNASAKSAITGWTNVGDLDVARTTTAGDLPREFTTASGIKITADANTQSVADYVYYDFSLDDVDLSKKLKIQWAQKTTGTYAAGDLAVIITTQADRTTVLHTPITTAIPAVNGVFTTYFDASTTATLSLVIRATTDMTTDGGIVISDVIVGPGIQPQGAVVGDWQSYTPTGTWSTNTTYAGKYRRVGDTAEIDVTISLSGAPNSATLDELSLPIGLTVNTSALSDPSPDTISVYYGYGTLYDDSTTATINAVVANSATANKFRILGMDDGAAGLTNTSVTQAAPWTWASLDRIHVTLTVPIAEWAGSGTVNLGQNDVEYASNSGTWDADDVTSFAYGPNGTLIPASTDLTTTRAKKVQFQTSIQATDKLTLQFKVNEVWVNAPDVYLRDTGFTILARQYGTAATAAETVGAGLETITSSSNAVYVVFGHYASIYNNATKVGWSSAISTSVIRWRVMKSSGGQAVGFGLADTAGNSGLVNPYSSSGAGVVYSGRWTPTITGVLAVDGSTAYSCHYSRVGKIVTCTGYMDIDPNAAGTNTEWRISLPIASNLTSYTDCNGMLMGENVSGVLPAYIDGDTTNDQAHFFCVPVSRVNQGFHFHFMYEIK